MNARAWGATIHNREEKFELKRQAVLASAARIIRRSSFETLSLADIAVDLHVAKPTIYYYFRNKEEIVRELMQMAVASLLDTESHPQDYPDAPGLNGIQRFERFVRRCIRVTSDDVGACLFIVYPNQLPVSLRRDLEVLGQPVIDWAERLLREGIDDRSIAGHDPSMVYLFIVNGLRCLPVLIEMGRGSIEALSDHLLTIVVRGIAPPAT